MEEWPSRSVSADVNGELPKLLQEEQYCGKKDHSRDLDVECRIGILTRWLFEVNRGPLILCHSRRCEGQLQLRQRSAGQNFERKAAEA